MKMNDDIQMRWWSLKAKLAEKFNKPEGIDMEAILFLIGMQETGFSPAKISKEQKQDLMHVAVCTLLSSSGYFELEKVDNDGWPHFKQLKEIKIESVFEQEDFLKDHILLYFEQNGFL